MGQQCASWRDAGNQEIEGNESSFANLVILAKHSAATRFVGLGPRKHTFVDGVNG